jgi:hypothetical protein
VDQAIEAQERKPHSQVLRKGLTKAFPSSKKCISLAEQERILIREALETAGVGLVRREISDEEIIERCIYVMVNEGAR